MSMIKPPPGVISKKRRSQISNLKWLADKKAAPPARRPEPIRKAGASTQARIHLLMHAWCEGRYISLASR